jgi:pseudaminic acid synthase
MKIGDREIGFLHPPYIIAEASCNHGGSFDRAMELIDAAAACRADAIKFQCYTADSMTLDSDRPEFIIQDGPWKGRRLYDLYRKAETPPGWFTAIKERAEAKGIHWFASVFDKAGVDLMVRLKAPALKIASFEITDLPLIRYAASTGLPLLISTGMATEEDRIRAARAVIGNFTFLECTSGYPTPFEDVGLHALWGSRGISDHTLGYEVPIAATALGATVIEKHFKCLWHPETEDSAFSMDEIDFAQMVKSVHNTWTAMQPRSYRSEDGHRQLRRSLFVTADVAAGELLTHENVRSIRPGGGLEPRFLCDVVGRAARRTIKRGEPLAWDMIDLA